MTIEKVIFKSTAGPRSFLVAFRRRWCLASRSVTASQPDRRIEPGRVHQGSAGCAGLDWIRRPDTAPDETAASSIREMQTAISVVEASSPSGVIIVENFTKLKLLFSEKIWLFGEITLISAIISSILATLWPTIQMQRNAIIGKAVSFIFVSGG